MPFPLEDLKDLVSRRVLTLRYYTLHPCNGGTRASLELAMAYQNRRGDWVHTTWYLDTIVVQDLTFERSRSCGYLHLCASCGSPASQHAGEKCLFAATAYSPIRLWVEGLPQGGMW